MLVGTAARTCSSGSFWYRFKRNYDDDAGSINVTSFIKFYHKYRALSSFLNQNIINQATIKQSPINHNENILDILSISQCSPVSSSSWSFWPLVMSALLPWWKQDFKAPGLQMNSSSELTWSHFPAAVNSSHDPWSPKNGVSPGCMEMTDNW